MSLSGRIEIHRIRCVRVQYDYHSVILSVSEESPKSINKWEILHYVQDDKAKR